MMRRIIGALCVSVLLSGAASAQSWTAPRTWVTSELVTAALMNTHVRDNLIVLRAGGLALSSQAANDLVYASSTTQLARIAAAANSTLVTNGSNVPSLSTTLPSAVQANITAAGTITSGVWNAGAVTSSGAVTGTSGIWGTTPATAGIVRIPNAQYLTARNAANADNVRLIGLDGSDQVRLAIDGQTTILGGLLSTTSHIFIPSLSGLYFDGGSDTFIREAAANDLRITTGGTLAATFTASGVNFYGFAVNSSGVVTSSSVGTDALRTATGSFTDTNGGSVVMNDYSFFPNFELDDCSGGTGFQAMGIYGANATNDQIGRFEVYWSGAPCSSGSYDVRWRYVTSSDNPDIWVTTKDGVLTGAWQSEDPINDPLGVATGETAIHLDVPSVAEIKTMLADLSPTLQQKARTDFLAYLVKRGWASPLATLSDAIDNVPQRYRRAARMWAVRFIAQAAEIDPAELMLETMRVQDGRIVPKANYAAVVDAHRAARTARMALQ